MEAQRTLEWYRKRLGKFTGSRIGELMKKPKSGNGFSETAMSYIYQVAGERMMNPSIVDDDNIFADYLAQTDISSKQMRWGTENEPDARNIYELKTGRRIVEVGSCQHKDIPNFAASPDGFFYDEETGEKGIIEIKCVGVSTFVRYREKIHDNETLLATEPKYYWQIMAELMCVGANWCDFVVYNPFLVPSIFIVRIMPDEESFKQIAERIAEAEKILQSITKQ